MERNNLTIGQTYFARISFSSAFGQRIQIGERLEYKGNYNFTRIDEQERYFGDPKNVTLNDDQMVNNIWLHPVCNHCIDGQCNGEVLPTFVALLDKNGDLEKDWAIWACDAAKMRLKENGFLVNEPY